MTTDKLEKLRDYVVYNESQEGGLRTLNLNSYGHPILYSLSEAQRLAALHTVGVWGYEPYNKAKHAPQGATYGYTYN